VLISTGWISSPRADSTKPSEHIGNHAYEQKNAEQTQKDD
jgi:hypothetical protein